jgi:hypothetical protein
VSSTPAEVRCTRYTINVIKLVSHLRQVGGFLRFSQLYRGGQCFWWRKLEDPEETIDLPHVTDKLYHIFLYTSLWSRFYGCWLRTCEKYFFILFPQLIILFPQERYVVPTTYYFVPTTLLSCSRNILFCSVNISYCSLNILLLILISYPLQQRQPILSGQISNVLR